MDIILYNIIACFASLIFGYFLGSIPFGIILCKAFRGEDPREKGSKNSGGTNVGRLYGMKLGAFTIILDAIKTIFPMICVWFLINFASFKEIMVKNFGENFYLNGYLIIAFAPLGASVGHCWPIYANFRGGKAVSNFAGFVLFTSWLNFFVGFLSFGITLKKSKFVSLSSIIGSISVCLSTWILFILNKASLIANVDFFCWGFGKTLFWFSFNLPFCLVTSFLCLILITRHTQNIKRLCGRCESKIKWMK